MTLLPCSRLLPTRSVGKLYTCCKRGRIGYVIVAVVVSICILCYIINANIVFTQHEKSEGCERNINYCIRLEERIKQLTAIKIALKDEIKILVSKRLRLSYQVNKLTVHPVASNNGGGNIQKINQENVMLKQLIGHQNSQITWMSQRLTDLGNALDDQNKVKPQWCRPAKIDFIWKHVSKKKLPNCNLLHCFDWSRCGMAKTFTAFVYPPNKDVDTHLVNQSLKSIPFLTNKPLSACIQVVIINSTAISSLKVLQQRLRSLPHWNSSGKNHLIADFGWSTQRLLTLDIGYAMIAAANFVNFIPRQNFDIVIPPLHLRTKHSVNNMISPPALSALRDILLCFRGSPVINNTFNQFIESELNELSHTLKDTDIKVYITTKCQTVNRSIQYQSFEWYTCQDDMDYITKRSTFMLVIIHNSSCISSTLRVLHALLHGSIPVFLIDHFSSMSIADVLPFGDFIDWNLAGIVLPLARLPEMAKLLMTIENFDIVKMRSHGQFLYKTYFSSNGNSIHAILALLRSRLKLPPYPIQQQHSRQFSTLVVNHSNIAIKQHVPFIVPSPTYLRNFSINFYKIWNSDPGPFWLFPFTPYDPLLPMDSQVNGFGKGFQLINDGGTASGKMFSKHLGGNYPLEHFTIVILTHNRPQILKQRLIKFSHLHNLNKVVVVWNEYNKYAQTFQWPDIHIPIHVFQSKKNSLNSRFFPFDAIDTEAVLSVDDDVDLDADQIDFAFRVWRESRDRIVGFPARHHTWDKIRKRWSYNSNYACQLSMVLTGAAFLHKYYLFLYTYWMPERIRMKVDEFMNCEDIAMNFLVSHISKKPPIKVTSRWGFNCPTCNSTLTRDALHFEERSVCINYFVKIYDYMPLKYTQYRADSILYRIKLPDGMQKCYPKV